jgi:hypothetical protein
MGKATNEAKPLKGVLFFLDEMGMDVGSWAFQDETFITPNTTYFSCTKCGLVWDKSKESEEAVLAKRAATGELSGRRRCSPTKHTFALTMPFHWSWDGAHIIKDGDILTIFDKDDSTKKVWSGNIKLKQYESVKCPPNTLTPIISKQKDIKRARWISWFVNKHPAKLTPLPKKKE